MSTHFSNTVVRRRAEKQHRRAVERRRLASTKDKSHKIFNIFGIPYHNMLCELYRITRMCQKLKKAGLMSAEHNNLIYNTMNMDCQKMDIWFRMTDDNIEISKIGRMILEYFRNVKLHTQENKDLIENAICEYSFNIAYYVSTHPR